MEKEEYIEKLFDRIKVLNETLWEGRVRKSNINQWLENFETNEEKLHALHLLSEFVYYGSVQMRHLLKSLYRDLYKYPLIENIRRANSDSLDASIIELEFKKVELKTKFFGVGNPSESGAHMLYFFRQENKLSKKLFINSDEIFIRTGVPLQLKDPDIEYYVFIDDFCGTGSQVTTEVTLKDNISNIKKLNSNAKIFYLMLFGTSKGISNVRKSGMFDHVDAVIEIDKTFRCFDTDSRYFDSKNTFVDKAQSKLMALKYGTPLIKDVIEKETPLTGAELDAAASRNALGFRDCQLLLGFHHNTPDNTLPIIWYDETGLPWTPIFKRYNKKYGF